MASLPQPGRSRTPLFIGLGIAVFLLSLILFSQTSLNLDFIQPSPQQTLLFAALSALIFLLFVVLTFILARNLLKLLAERRMGVLGSRFRTRMVIGAFILSFLPVIFMFQFAYVLMNRSIDKWFSGPVEALREDSERLSELLTTYATTNARAEAQALAADPGLRRAVQQNDEAAIRAQLELHRAGLENGFALVRLGNHPPIAYRTPAPLREMASALDPLLRAPAGQPPRITWGDVEYLAGSEAIGPDARIYVAMPLPPRLAATMKSIEANHMRYYELGRDRRAARRLFMQQLLLITVLVLFAATWLSLFVSRLVTQPVAALAAATNEISQGHLDYRVQVRATDELGELVSSFNRMAAELETNRLQIEQSRRELADTNVALKAANDAIEHRRREIETILQNVPTGVLSLDAAQRVTHTNGAFAEMFGRKGTDLSELFEPAIAFDLERLLRRADRMGTSSREMQIQTARGPLQLEVTAASLQHDRQREGYVLVFEDLSDLLHAQKQVAWREVARRVAHEIKNPLTPIALSAERIRRHLERHKEEAGARPDGQSLAVIASCAETISSAVETVRTLVDEFSTLARFPTAQPQPTNINQVVESALQLFSGRLDGISLRTELDPRLPETMADPEGIKRVVANLVDNAAEAMRNSLVKEIHIRTSLVSDAGHDAVEICVSDTGHGVTAELKEKLFLPYFSTKDRGTGLGLAIVNRIVEEHRGSVRVEENRPAGARFIVELPLTTKPLPKPESTHV